LIIADQSKIIITPASNPVPTKIKWELINGVSTPQRGIVSVPSYSTKDLVIDVDDVGVAGGGGTDPDRIFLKVVPSEDSDWHYFEPFGTFML